MKAVALLVLPYLFWASQCWDVMQIGVSLVKLWSHPSKRDFPGKTGSLRQVRRDMSRLQRHQNRLQLLRDSKRRQQAVHELHHRGERGHTRPAVGNRQSPSVNRTCQFDLPFSCRSPWRGADLERTWTLARTFTPSPPSTTVSWSSRTRSCGTRSSPPSSPNGSVRSRRFRCGNFSFGLTQGLLLGDVQVDQQQFRRHRFPFVSGGRVVLAGEGWYVRRPQRQEDHVCHHRGQSDHQEEAVTRSCQINYVWQLVRGWLISCTLQ